MWINISQKLPPEKEVVLTKIECELHGERNTCLLYRQGNLWFIEDGSMYVYYKPTHWMRLK